MLFNQRCGSVEISFSDPDLRIRHPEIITDPDVRIFLWSLKKNICQIGTVRK
jgi:hypothetical protein